MTLETLFLALHVPVFAAWGLLAIAPRWHVTNTLVNSALIFLLLGAVYLWLLARGILGESTPGAGFTSLEAVMALFAHPVGALNSWVHFLLFDLFVGAWIVRDALRLEISRWGTLPFLGATLMFGPLGLAFWLLFRGLSGRGWSLVETPSRRPVHNSSR